MEMIQTTQFISYLSDEEIHKENNKKLKREEKEQNSGQSKLCLMILLK